MKMGKDTRSEYKVYFRLFCVISVHTFVAVLYSLNSNVLHHIWSQIIWCDACFCLTYSLRDHPLCQYEPYNSFRKRKNDLLFDFLLCLKAARTKAATHDTIQPLKI